MVCSQEIAASTTQLVVSSKVKAERGSTNLGALAEASRAVTQATARVVASAKSGADAIEEIGELAVSRTVVRRSEFCFSVEGRVQPKNLFVVSWQHI